MGAKIQALDIFQTPLNLYPLPLSPFCFTFKVLIAIRSPILSTMIPDISKGPQEKTDILVSTKVKRETSSKMFKRSIQKGSKTTNMCRV
jgi:hypothetical protein